MHCALPTLATRISSISAKKALSNVVPVFSRARITLPRSYSASLTRPSPSPFADSNFELDMTTEARDLASRAKKPQKSITQAKTPKGTSDWLGADSDLRQEIVDTVSTILRRHGGTSLETPMFELTEILQNKLGEDQKLIYDLADQGGEMLSLRYDLSVSFARWLAMNSNVQQIKRMSVGNVFRRDQPAIQKGRFREFRQLDFDIAGSYDPMIADAEVISILVEAFDALGLGNDITIRINHRKILDGMFRVVGVPEDKIRTISSAVDKLDKAPWEEVKKEMVEQKGLPMDVADKIGELVQQKGSLSNILQRFRIDQDLSTNQDIQKGLDDMTLLLQYTEAFQAADKVSFDLSLARGLDYYTGLIYEVVATLPGQGSDRGAHESQVGSIAAGGRYDNLVGTLGKTQIPCVGVSFGIDRIFTILKPRRNKPANGQLWAGELDAFAMAFGSGFLTERMAVARELRAAGIKTDYMAKVKPKLQQQFKAAESTGARVAVIVGENEIAAGKINVKILGLSDDDPEKEGRLVLRQDMVSEVKKSLAALGPAR